jgi:hypothetical protein
MGYALLADILVAVHFAFVAFVVAGQLLIMLGAVCRWRWVRNPWFRVIHLLAIGVVAFEAAMNIECPCTVWERQLRALAQMPVEEGSFIGRLAHNLLFYNAPEIIFRRAHMVFGALVFLTFVLAPPSWKRRRPPAATTAPDSHHPSPLSSPNGHLVRASDPRLAPAADRCGAHVTQP